MKTDACPKCGSDKREIFTVGSALDVRFKSETSSALSFKKKVVALACSSCGYIELFLADHDSSDVA
jgi:predicted nucleic-acid-binding Zn-ribbon protein